MPIHDWTRVTPGIFHHFHHEWISTISRALNDGRLPHDYYALAEQVTGGLGPDVLTLEALDKGSSQGNGSTLDDSDVGVAVATAPPKVQYTASVENDYYSRNRNRIAIRHSSEDRVVAIVEIVSPGNKSSTYALDKFVEKALEFLDAGIQLLVIDLFPAGPRDPNGIHDAIWSHLSGEHFQPPADQPLTLAAYETGDIKRAYIEPTAAGKQLVDMPLFLNWNRYIDAPLESTYVSAFEAVPQRWQDELT